MSTQKRDVLVFGLLLAALFFTMWLAHSLTAALSTLGVVLVFGAPLAAVMFTHPLENRSPVAQRARLADPLPEEVFKMSEEMSQAEVTTRMTFGDALKAVKSGHAVQRAGWNGKGMFVFLKQGSAPQAPTDETANPKSIDGVPGDLFYVGAPGTVTRLPALCLKTASGSILEGWLASQTDMLAEDWRVCEASEQR